MKPAPRRALHRAALLALLLAGRVPMAVAGRIDDASLPEVSGCAAAGGALWVHNDSGNPPRLFALDDSGRLRRTLAVDGAADIDWEDIAAVHRPDSAGLALADTGDNFAWREQVEILLFAAPEAAATRLHPVRTIRFRYADGPRDVEALAVDAVAGDILLLEKRRPPAGLYRLALDGPATQTAVRIATLPDWWPEPPRPVETIGERRYRGAPTAMDLAPDGRRLAVLTPTHWMLFARGTGESWAAALARAPRVARLPRPPEMPQDTIFEALCWAADGGLWISGEGRPAPLIHVAPAALR